MTRIELAQGACSQGHRWDAWGFWETPKRFIPDEMQVYLCPTCNGLAQRFVAPERLA